MKYIKYCDNCKNRMELTFSGTDNITKMEITIICKNCKKNNTWKIGG